MIWNIMIITKDYDKYVEFFRKQKDYIEKWQSTKTKTEIYSGFTRIIIMKYISPRDFRGYRAHLIYIDDDLIKNEELQEILLPCVIYGNRCLLPISSLYLNI